MEVSCNNKLQILTAKTWDLHVRMNDKIREKGFSFCNNCSNQSRYAAVSGTTTEEVEKMIAITHSLQQLHNILLYLQGVRSSQEIQRDEALGRLQESRKILLERVNQFSEKNRKLDVVNDVIEFIGHGKKDENTEHKNVSNGILNFLVRFTRFGLEFAVIFASIYASVELCKSRDMNHKLKKEAMDARILGKSDIQLDVLCGRG